MQVTPHNFAETNGGRERRGRPRHVPSSVSYVSVDNANGGVIVDISEMGMAISSAEPITDGGTHTLRFQLPRLERTFETPASLVWASDSKRNAGVRFDSLSLEDRLQIRNWLKDELFAEAFPARAAARRKLVFSYDTLGDTAPSATRATPANGAVQNGAASNWAGPSGREATPRVARKELADLQASVTTDWSSEFDKLFPSERTLSVELQPRPGKFARLAESTSSIDTTALWMNFPSEAELAASAAAVEEAPAAIATPEVDEAPAIDAPAAVEQAEVETIAAPHENEVVQAEAPEEVVVAPALESETVDVAGVEAAEVIAGPVEAEQFEIATSAAGEISEEAALPSVEAGALTDLSVPMVAATAELEEAERIEELVAHAEAVASPIEHQDEFAATVEPIVASGAAHIEVPAELLVPPRVFASPSPVTQDVSEEPVHELNPEPQGPEVAANRLDLLDISQAVRAPGKYSSANPVSDASIESLLAIAEEEESATRRSQALKVVPDRKREPIPTPVDQILTEIASESPDGLQSMAKEPVVVSAASANTAEPAKSVVSTPEPFVAAVASTPKPVRRVTPTIGAMPLARPVAPIASASALPHVALRSASQQTIHHDALLGDGDKKYRGLVIIAIFVLLAGCFAVGYSRHIGVEWPWSASSTATNTNPATPKAQPPAASAPDAPDPSSAAPAIRTPTTITPSSKKSGTTPLPDASNVQPDATFEASAPPPAQPASPSFFPVTAPSEGDAPRMVTLPEVNAFDSPRVAIRLRQDFFVPPQPGPEWKHSLERIQIGEATSKTPPPPAGQSDAGTVHVRATVGTDGTVKNVRPIDGPVALIPRSVDAIKKWRYQPSLLQGQPVEWQGDFSIEFRPAR